MLFAPQNVYPASPASGHLRGAGRRRRDRPERPTAADSRARRGRYHAETRRKGTRSAAVRRAQARPSRPLRRRAVAGTRLRPAGEDGRRRRRGRTERTLRQQRSSAAHHPPPDAHPGGLRVRPPAAQPPLRAGPAPDPAGRERLPAAGHLGPSAPGATRRGDRRDREHGTAGRRRGGLRRAGPLTALDADVHRGGPARPAALHGRGQGAAGAGAGRAGARAAVPHRHAGGHRADHHHPGGVPGGTGDRAGDRLRHGRQRAGGRASAASPSRSPAPPRPRPSPSRVRPDASPRRPRTRSSRCCTRSRRSCPPLWPPPRRPERPRPRDQRTVARTGRPNSSTAERKQASGARQGADGAQRADYQQQRTAQRGDLGRPATGKGGQPRQFLVGGLAVGEPGGVGGEFASQLLHAVQQLGDARIPPPVSVAFRCAIVSLRTRSRPHPVVFARRSHAVGRRRWAQ